MEYKELVNYLETSGMDPSRLIFEDDLTGLFNRRYLYHFLQTKIEWSSIGQKPLSLMMLDLDYFKSINDNYGHEVGDRALIWLAKHLKEVAGAHGIPIRYAGDEFMILFKDFPKESCLQVGEALIQQIRQQPFQTNGQNSQVALTVSMGVATAPNDAVNGKALVQIADTALYASKQNGRDQLTDAGKVRPEDVFSKTAIYKLDNVKIVGRSKQLGAVGTALKRFSQNQSPFLVAEGPAGIGKSEFLETIRKNLSRTRTLQIYVNGSPQELYRPYYLTERIIFRILKQRRDKGVPILKNLSAKERAYLSRLFPQLKSNPEILSEESEATQREGLFKLLLHLVPKLVNQRPLMLYVDDMHFADEASLLMLRQLILTEGFALFICSTATEAKSGDIKAPLPRFLNKFSEELGIQRLSLTPLTDADIADHIQTLFPQIKLPKGFEKELARVSQGNPLFFGEILRKLVLDQKISLIGQQWVIQPIEKGYLPKSLEEIVTAQIVALDEESRDVLDQVSAMGEDVPLSMIIGSSEQMESKVLEFIDKAAAQGLISSDFQMNDEVIRFLGKRILEITYNAIEPERKEKLHEKIGTYQESLYQQQLLSSAASLAYHFQRSTNHEKASNYEKILSASNNRNFNAEEALAYTAGETGETGETEVIDIPLNPADIPKVPKFIRDFMVAVRNIKLYPPGSKSIIGVVSQTKASLFEILANNETLNLMQIKQLLVVNGQKMDVTDFKWVAEGFLKFLNRFDLKGIAFHRGLTDSELELLIEEIGRNQKKMYDESHWKRFTAENRITHITLKQLRYTISGKSLSKPAGRPKPGRSEAAGAGITEETLPAGTDSQLLNQLPLLLRGLMGAVRVTKLYPLKSKTVGEAIQHLHACLSNLLQNRSSITLAQAGYSLFVNGERVNVSGYQKFADQYINLLQSIGLGSLTFLKQIPLPELEAFMGALNKLPFDGVDLKYWQAFAGTNGLSHILFNQTVYEVKVTQSSGTVPLGQDMPEHMTSEGTVAFGQGLPEHMTSEGAVAPGRSMLEQMTSVLDAPPDEPIPDEDFEGFLSQFSDTVRHIMEAAKQKTLKRVVEQLFNGYADRRPAVRERIISTSRSVLENLTPAFQHDLAETMTDPLLTVFDKESDQKILIEMAVLLNRMVVTLINLVNYPSAARIYSRLLQRQTKIKPTRQGQAQMLKKSLEVQLSSATQNLLVADLKSAEPIRQRNAAQLIESIGPAAWPLLINVIKQDDDLRVRQTAALLLSKQGPKAIERVKRLLVLEITAEERVRVLSIIDTLSNDLLPELMHAIGDDDRKVQLAAFRLAERLHDDRVIELMIANAKTARGKVAVGAINAIEKLKPPEAINTLRKLMLNTKEEPLRVACCRALGQIAKPECIEPLETVLKKRTMFKNKYRFSPKVRATAAFALGHMGQPRALNILEGCVEDADQRVREIAKAIVDRARSNESQQSEAIASND